MSIKQILPEKFEEWVNYWMSSDEPTMSLPEWLSIKSKEYMEATNESINDNYKM